MRKLSLLVLAGLLLAAASYQMLATDSLAGRATERQELEITARNAAIGAFTDAKHLVEAAATPERFAGPGTSLTGEYEGAFYRTHIAARGETISIHASAVMTDGVDTVDFSISAEVAWASNPTPKAGTPAARYLVLKAYHEE